MKRNSRLLIVGAVAASLSGGTVSAATPGASNGRGDYPDVIALAGIQTSHDIGMSDFARRAQAATPAADAPSPAMVVAEAPSGVAMEGRVERLLLNPFGEVDGLLLSTGRVVKFPAHQGPALAQVAALGQNVRVEGEAERGGEVKALRVVNAASAAQAVRQARPWWPPEAPRWLRERRLASMQSEGRVAVVLTGKRGEVKRVILDNGHVIHLPKHSLLPQPLRTGMTFAAAGRGTRGQYGTALLAARVGPTLGALQPLTRVER